MTFYRKVLLYLFMIYFASVESKAYRILGVFPLNSRSHNNVFESLMKGLAKRGHQVDVVAHFEINSPPKNYQTIINLSGLVEPIVNNWTMKKVSSFGDMDFVTVMAQEAGNKLCELLSFDKIQKLIRTPPNDPPYDLMITEACTANCYIGLGYVLRVPVITISSSLDFTWAGEVVGNPPSTAFALNLFNDRADISTFWDRLENTWLHHINKFKFFWYTDQAQTAAMRRYISPDIPNIREVEKSVALKFVNSYHSLYGAKPTIPAFVEIAGIHIEAHQAKLTPELQAWMDESKDGVVYFTLGSMVIIESLPKETLLEIYTSFAKIAPIRVLMKITDKSKLPLGLPKNILTLPWIPQIPVLKHYNTRLFITHGGLLSIQEALYYGVPMIGIPLFADQFLNVNVVTKKNIAVKMNYRNISEKSLDKALNAILYDTKYRDAAKRESHLFRDRPMTATDTATFWVEYVIRNGVDAIRSTAVDLYWWQIELLDVYGFLMLCVFVIIYISVLISKIVLKLILNNLCCFPGKYGKID